MTLSTHVLDVARGVPAAGIAVTLVQTVGAMRIDLATATTDEDGRIVAPFGGDLRAGEYELVFKAGAYFKTTETPSFYAEVPVRFVISEARHYHVPLLLSPWGYTTYRGS